MSSYVKYCFFFSITCVLLIILYKYNIYHNFKIAYHSRCVQTIKCFGFEVITAFQSSLLTVQQFHLKDQVTTLIFMVASRIWYGWWWNVVKLCFDVYKNITLLNYSSAKSFIPCCFLTVFLPLFFSPQVFSSAVFSTLSFSVFRILSSFVPWIFPPLGSSQ